MRSDHAGVTALNDVAHRRHINLTTFRRDGRGVPTPVGFVVDNGEIFVLTAPSSGKVKRLRNNSAVLVTPCDGRGGVAPDAQTIAGTARLLDADGTAYVRRIMARRFPVARLVFGWDRLRGRLDRWVAIAVAV